MRRLVLLRHGRTEWNDSGRAQGHADVPLDDVGLAQAKEVAPVLAALRPVAVWSSDLARAAGTAAAVAAECGLGTVLDPRLREFDVGPNRQGLTAEQLAERAGINRGTLRRLEHGDPAVGSGVLLSVLRALGQLDRVVEALDPYETDLGRARADESLPQRVRR